MAAKGKWAQGIQPRHFHWVIQDQLAVCERPGGFGSNHRKVRRQEEIIWIREQGVDLVVSISPAPHNLHNYDELGVRWLHWPFPANEDLPRYLVATYTELRRLLGDKRKLMLHADDLSEPLVGLLAGYLVWTGMVTEPPRAITLIEHVTGRQLGAEGRGIVAEAAARAGVLPEERDRAQPLEVDLDVHLDLSAAAASDRLEDTVDYGAICDRCARVAATAEPLLLERLAGLLAEAVLGSDPRIDAVSVSVRKLRPPVPHDLSTSGVRILRRRSARDGDR